MSGLPRVVGIDPGLSGALGVLTSTSVDAWDLPIAGSDLNIDGLVRIIRDAKPDFAVIERASSRPGQGVVSVFKFGQAYGMLRAIVGMCEIPLHIVTPSTWKKHFCLNSDKEESRSLALRLWPGTNLFNRKKDHQRAEACLIARYGVEVLWRRQ